MTSRLLLILFLLFSSVSFSQDTTWVQTYTFDTIATRRADFAFPQQLNTMRFEKVLMYYKLKCSPLTPWDSYDCGEWDYLAYTRIFDHTGVYDSVQVDSVQFLNNCQSNAAYDYDLWGYMRVDSLVATEQARSGFATTLNSLGLVNTGAVNAPYDLDYNGGRFQMLVTATELVNAGIVPGDIQSLALYVGGIMNNGELLYPRISIKGTADISITAFHDTGFLEVYNLSHSASGGAPDLIIGENELEFYQPYTWNGTDNLIIEFSFERSVASTNSMTFEHETSAPDMALNYGNKNGVLNFSGSEYAVFEMSDLDLGNDVTIAFWAKGNGNTGVNTSVLEAWDTLNQRVINIHMPWSNNRLYWDAGEGSGYDRIDKDAVGAGMDNEWHHWAFIKNQGTGEMKIMRDGVLWHNGTGFNRPVGYIHRLVIGANRSLGNNWKGKIDEFQIYNTAVDEATILAWYKNKIDPSHPNWANLLTYYDFDDQEWAMDQSQNSYLLMPSSQGLFDFSELPVAGVQTANRPLMSFGQGIVSGAATDVYVPYLKLKEPEVVFEYAPVYNHFEITNTFVGVPNGSEDSYDELGNLLSSVPFTGSSTLSNSSITYYEAPFEIINDVEIGRYITPYGIQFDLGTNGFTWIYDVTDYQMYLKDTVDLAAHNTQELIDLKFAFIEGIPPRDVHNRQPIWSDWKSYSYSNLDNDVSLPAIQVALSDSSSMFKIKTRMTGHGQVGSAACCEWKNNTHMISVDGTQQFSWNIWRNSACGDNPNVSQGGTWPYAREGWCPGDMVPEYDHELTPFVTPGTTVTLDYDITPVSVADPGQGAGNYVTAMDLISYSAPNFQNDAAIVDVLNPNNYEYYGKWNPSCSNPRVMIQNTGEQALTSCIIRCWISSGDYLEYQWTGNLAFLEKEIVEIPVVSTNWWQDYWGTQTFTAHIMDVNGANLDEYAPNNEKAVKFDAPESINGPFLAWFTTNNKANENKWRLIDDSGNIIFERTTLTNTTDYKDTFDLASGCYSIIIEDNDSDGLGYWYSAQTEGETNGTFRIKLVGGIVVETFPRDFGNYHRYNFSVGFTVGADEAELTHEIAVYPNPNEGEFYVELSGNIGSEAQLQVIDLMGRQLLTQKMEASSNFASSKVEIPDAPSGHYIIRIVTNDGVYTKEFAKM